MAGFIHGMLDIKLLVLYLAAKAAGPLEVSALTDMALCDDGVDYFQYTEALDQLVDSGLLRREGDTVQVTEKGREVCAGGESSLSPVIRARCDRRLAPLNAALRRKAQVRAQVEPLPEGWRVSLALDDEKGSLLSLSLLAPSKEEGESVAARFTAHPDRVYNGILAVLLDDGRAGS